MFGSAIVNAVVLVAALHHGVLGGTTGWAALSSVSQLLGWGAGAIALTLLVARSYGIDTAAIGLRPADTAARRWRDLDVAAASLVAIAAGAVAQLAIGRATGFPDIQVLTSWPTAVTAALAGPVEELAALAVPFLLLRRAGEPSWRIAVVLVAARLAYHVYYGWTALGLSLWALATIAIFARTRRVLPILVAHSLWDLCILGGKVVWPGSLAFQYLLVGWALVWGTVRFVLRLVARARRASAPTAPV